MKKILSILLICWALFPIHSVLAASADTTALPVLSRGHIQDLGDYPADGSWVESPKRIGTVGQSKRIEGFELKAGESLPTDLELRYNVHVQNIGWLYDEDDPTSWAKNGDYAGTRGDGLRIEAIKIVLLDAAGNKASGYHIRYQGHVQNIGDLPADSEQWFTDGEQLGTVGSSLRLEALKLEIVKGATTGTDLSAYTDLTNQIDSLTEADYSKSSWSNLQTIVSQNRVDEQSSASAITTAIANIREAINRLENLTTATIYNKTGTYGPATGNESIAQDVIITTGDLTLQNLTVDGNLIIDEAVGIGNVSLNNVSVSGELRVRGGGQNSIHISGGKYAKILVEQAPDGGVRIVATGVDGVPVVLSENAAGETLILEGTFDSLTIGAPDAVIKTQGQTSIKTVDVTAGAKNAALNLGNTTTVASLAIAAPAKVTGSGKISKAAITGDNVVFEIRPDSYTVDPVVIIPPVIPTPQSGGGSGGGGGYTPPSKISLSVTTAPTVTLSKTYDGSTVTDVTNQILNAAAITGIVAGDDVAVSATATYDNKNVSSNKDITITYSLSGTNAGKYNPPAATTIKGAITPKPLNGATTTAITKEFDGTTTLTTVITENLGQLNADTLTITRTATYQNNSGTTDAIEVGTDKPVTCSYNLSGTDACNYSAPADHSGTGNITKKNLTVSAASLSINKNKTYDGTIDVFNGKGKIEAGNNAISVATGVVGEPAIIVTATAAYDSPNAGSSRIITVSYTIGSNSANGRYQIAATETLSGASISARILTIPPLTPVTKAYDGTVDVFAEANNADKIYNMPITPGNIAATDAGKVTVTATAAYDTGKDAGASKNITICYTLTGEAAGNYQPLPDDRSKTASITPLSIATSPVVKDSDKTKEYDSTSKAAVTVRVTDINQKPIVQEAILNGTLVFDTTAVYKDNNSETSNVGSGYMIAYTYKLSGTAAHNFSLAGAAFDGSINGTIGDGGITARKLSVTADGMGLQTEKTYDGNTNTNVNGRTITGGTGLTGIVGTEKVSATASSQYDSADAGDHNIITSFTLSGDDAGNYRIDPLTSSGTIKPIQLEVDNTKLPAIAAARKYDATRDVYLEGTSTKLSGYTLSADAISGLVNSEVVTVKATASYDTKDIGSGKSITIAYSLSGDAAKNYLAPVADTSKTAAITPRILGYSNVNLATVKKSDGSSGVMITDAKADPTTANSMDGIVHIDGIESNPKEDVNLGSYSADYYDGNQKTSNVGSNYTIKLTATLTGNHAGNYLMADYTYSQKGQILAANAVISTPYNSPNWNVAGILYAPAANFKLFYAKQDGANTTFYGYDSTGQIYSSPDLSTWTTGEKVTIDGSKKLIGVDNSWGPLAIDSNYTEDVYTNKYYQIYCWLSGWSDYNDQSPEITSIIPINPTYYTDNNNSYLIYQTENNKVFKCLFSGSSSTEIGSNPGPSIPGGFTNSLLVYNDTNLMLYAY